MNDIELNICLDRDIMARWPEWKPTEQEVSDLRYWLRPYKAETVSHAARLHLAESTWHKPKIKGILDVCKKEEPNLFKRGKATAIKWPIFVQCIANGHYNQVCTLSTCPDELSMQAAENLRANMEAAEGSECIIIRESDQRAMYKRFFKIWSMNL